MQKGVATILRERNLFRDSNGFELRLQCRYCKGGDGGATRDEAIQSGWIDSKCCARWVLSQQQDFLEQEEWLTEECKKQGFTVIFYPKYHCELNFIESVWGWLKSYHRRRCSYKYDTLKSELPVTIAEKIPLSFIRRAERSALRFMSGYRQGFEGPVLDYTMRKYHGHRTIPEGVLEKMNKEYEDHQQTLLKSRKMR